MICPPALIDYGTEEDAGEWLAMLPHCLNITVSEYRACSTSRDTPAGGASPIVLPAGPFEPFHDQPNSPLEQAKHD